MTVARALRRVSLGLAISLEALEERLASLQLDLLILLFVFAQQLLNHALLSFLDGCSLSLATSKLLFDGSILSLLAGFSGLSARNLQSLLVTLLDELVLEAAELVHEHSLVRRQQLRRVARLGSGSLVSTVRIFAAVLNGGVLLNFATTTLQGTLRVCSPEPRRGSRRWSRGLGRCTATSPGDDASFQMRNLRFQLVQVFFGDVPATVAAKHGDNERLLLVVLVAQSRLQILAGLNAFGASTLVATHSGDELDEGSLDWRLQLLTGHVRLGSRQLGGTLRTAFSAPGPWTTRAALERRDLTERLRVFLLCLLDRHRLARLVGEVLRRVEVLSLTPLSFVGPLVLLLDVEVVLGRHAETLRVPVLDGVLGHDAAAYALGLSAVVVVDHVHLGSCRHVTLHKLRIDRKLSIHLVMTADLHVLVAERRWHRKGLLGADHAGHLLCYAQQRSRLQRGMTLLTESIDELVAVRHEERLALGHITRAMESRVVFSGAARRLRLLHKQVGRSATAVEVLVAREARQLIHDRVEHVVRYTLASLIQRLGSMSVARSVFLVLVALAVYAAATVPRPDVAVGAHALHVFDVLLKSVFSREIQIDLSANLMRLQLVDPRGESSDCPLLTTDEVVDDPLSETLVAAFTVPSRRLLRFELLDVFDFIAMTMLVAQASLDCLVPLLHAVLNIIQPRHFTQICEVLGLFAQNEREFAQATEVDALALLDGLEKDAAEHLRILHLGLLLHVDEIVFLSV